MMWNGNGMNGRGYAVMAVSNILFLGVVAVGFVALLRYLKPADRHPPPLRHRSKSSPTGTPTVIDDEEYRRRLDVLRAGASGLATV